MKACPFCAEQIQDDATKCRFCGEWLDKAPETPSAPTSYEVWLDSPGPLKIAAIKEVRQATGWGLKEAKTAVESAPVLLRLGLNQAQADLLARNLESQVRGSSFKAYASGTHGPSGSSRLGLTPPQPTPGSPPTMPQASTPGTSGGSKVGGTLGLLVLIVLAFAWCQGAFNGDSSGGGGGGLSGSHSITYNVTGGDGASVTYQTGSQDSAQDTSAATPWSDTETMSGGDFYYVSAQNQGGGTITCTVSVDGTQIDSNSSSGEFAICTASGTI